MKNNVLMRRIIFDAEDFDDIFKETGIDPNSITEHEWNDFTDMFIEGTHWSEVAEIAAEEIKFMRGVYGF